METNISKIFWKEAMTGGLVVGVVLFLWDLISYWMDLPMKSSGFASLVQFVLLVGGILYFSRRMREFRGPALGYPYGAAFGFVMGMSLFIGMVYGVGAYFLQIVIAPEYFNELFEIALLTSGLSEDLIEQTLTMRETMSHIMKNPIFFIFSGIFSMALYSGFIGLISAAFLKRPADPFADQTDEYNPEA